MIDHVSITVRDLARAAAFYDRVFAVIGLRRLVERHEDIGYGSKYPEFWLNQRAGAENASQKTGAHVCLRARSKTAVDDFHRTALAAGAGDDGGPGFRSKYAENYYAAFVRDLDGNRLEVVTFTDRAA